MADYFKAAKIAIGSAKRSVHFLNWAFDPYTYFHPQEGCTGPELDQIGPFLRDLACRKPELDIRILCWKSSLPIAATQNFFPDPARKCFKGSPVHLRLDGTLPLGACHHQKVVVIDDELAFCGGGDIGPDRWDTPEHLDDDPRRHKTEGKCFESRHELMGLVDGEAAAALGALFRERWLHATAVQLPEPPAPEPESEIQALAYAYFPVDIAGQRGARIDEAEKLIKWREIGVTDARASPRARSSRRTARSSSAPRGSPRPRPASRPRATRRSTSQGRLEAKDTTHLREVARRRRGRALGAGARRRPQLRFSTARSRFAQVTGSLEIDAPAANAAGGTSAPGRIVGRRVRQPHRR